MTESQTETKSATESATKSKPGQLPVDGGRKAVAQPLAQQAELQILRAHQQMTS